MTTWHDISLDSELAAKQLLRSGRHRSAVSRAYYAVYSRATDRLTRQGVRLHLAGRQNPAHESLAMLASRSLRSLSTLHRRRLRRSIERLYAYRVAADYFPGRKLEKLDALEAVGEMTVALKILDGRGGRA